MGLKGGCPRRCQELVEPGGGKGGLDRRWGQKRCPEKEKPIGHHAAKLLLPCDISKADQKG